MWQHIVEMASGEKRAVFGGSIASILAGIHMYSRAVWKEIVIEDHLEQVGSGLTVTSLAKLRECV